MISTFEMRIGYCKYCGQGHQIETSGECTEEQLQEWSTELCDCEPAQQERMRREYEEAARRNIRTLFGNHEVSMILEAGIHAVMIGAVESIVVTIGNGVKVTMKQDDKGKIKLEKVVTKKRVLEE